VTECTRCAELDNQITQLNGQLKVAQDREQHTMECFQHVSTQLTLSAERAQEFTQLIRKLTDQNARLIEFVGKVSVTAWSDREAERLLRELAKEANELLPSQASALQAAQDSLQDRYAFAKEWADKQAHPGPEHRAIERAYLAGWQTCSEYFSGNGVSTQELKHFAVTPFVAVCGADEMNQQTTRIGSGATCPDCLRWMKESSNDDKQGDGK
jgi:hypothetical protein